MQCTSIILVSKPGAMLSEHCVSEDFRRLPKHVKVALKWRGDRTTRLGVLGNGGLIHNSIGAEGVGRLASVLGVTHLDLSANKIGAGGTDSLAVALRRCKALADLCLGHNRIGVRGVGSLAGVLGGVQGADSSRLKRQRYWCRGSEEAGRCAGGMQGAGLSRLERQRDW